MGGRRKTVLSYYDPGQAAATEREFAGSEKTLAIHFRPIDAPVSFGVIMMKPAFNLNNLTHQQMGDMIQKSTVAESEPRPLTSYTTDINASWSGLDVGLDMKIWGRWLIYEPYLRSSLITGQYKINKRAHAYTIAATRMANDTDFSDKEEMTAQGLRIAPGIAFCPLKELHILVEYAWTAMTIQKRTKSMSFQHRFNDGTLADEENGEQDAKARHKLPSQTFSTGVAINF